MGAIYSLVAQTGKGKEFTCNAGDLGSILGLGRSPGGGGHGYALQYSCLENSHGQRTRRATVHGVAKSRTRLTRHRQGTFTNGNLIVCLMDI